MQMSLGDCAKCWEAPCVCGYEYEGYSPERRRELIDAVAASGPVASRPMADKLMAIGEALQIVENAAAGISSLDATEMYGEIVRELNTRRTTDGAVDGLLSSGLAEETTEEEIVAGYDCSRPVTPLTVSKFWKQMAYAELGRKRDSMSPEEVTAVQKFLAEIHLYTTKSI